MTKRKTSISINVLSVVIILISFFTSIVGYTNSWFTANHTNGVEILVNVGQLKLNLYQMIGANKTEIYTYENNKNADEKSYVQFSGPIAAGEKIPLNLILENKDEGSSSLYVRFKFKVYVRSEGTDKLMPVTLFTDITPAPEKSFKQNEGALITDYYYYKDANGNNIIFNKDESVNLMTHFMIDYSKMFDETSGEMIHTTSQSVYILVTIEGSVVDWQQQAS